MQTCVQLDKLCLFCLGKNTSVRLGSNLCFHKICNFFATYGTGLLIYFTYLLRFSSSFLDLLRTRILRGYLEDMSSFMYKPQEPFICQFKS